MSKYMYIIQAWTVHDNGAKSCWAESTTELPDAAISTAKALKEIGGQCHGRGYITITHGSNTEVKMQYGQGETND